ncbi:hypothetical protein KHQ81_06160 [Mycoplasmatota bacterium]|nr:hypothetical protein KHQ81_06160 [Mycoplasmatota bacterium]
MTAYKLIYEGRIKTVNIRTYKKPKYRILKEWFENFLNGTT